ncbi:MAG: sulfoxide reductase heme-binding subunit YedZ [Betaproteobacteria bacterium]|nr:sulfoxide reductase heme-binding subunit YedZ [Betaproteobacteria bacterium]
MRFAPRQLRWAKWIVFGLSLLPLLRLIALGVQDRLTANPIEFITRDTGDWALYFLCLTLTVTPLRRFMGLNVLVRFRRMLGLFTFFYASLHFLAFIWFDHFFDLAEMMQDIVKRPFIAMGFLAIVLLVPLAMTSNDFMLRKLGRHWSVLHRLIYLIAILALLHFWWMRAGKNNFAEPLVMSAVVAMLLALRLIWLRRDSVRRP